MLPLYISLHYPMPHLCWKLIWQPEKTDKMEEESLDIRDPLWRIDNLLYELKIMRIQLMGMSLMASLVIF